MRWGANILFISGGSARWADQTDGASGAAIPPSRLRGWSLAWFAAARWRAACLGRTPLSLSGRGALIGFCRNFHFTVNSKDLQHDPVA